MPATRRACRRGPTITAKASPTNNPRRDASGPLTIYRFAMEGLIATGTVAPLHAAGEANGNGGIVLVLSDRKSHVNVLQSILSDMDVVSDVLTGDTTKGDRKTLSDKIKAGDVRILIATGQLIGEGFDLPEIASVILATPLKF